MAITREEALALSEGEMAKVERIEAKIDKIIREEWYEGRPQLIISWEDIDFPTGRVELELIRRFKKAGWDADSKPYSNSEGGCFSVK